MAPGVAGAAGPPRLMAACRRLPSRRSRSTVRRRDADAPRLPRPASSPAVAIEPGEVFTQAVAAALIDAMLENSGSLVIAPDEWLTVAARDNAQGNRFVASDPSDVMTIVLRVKGSDLTDFQARRLTLDEVRKRVEVRAF